MSNIYIDNIIFSIQRCGGISGIWNELIKYLLKKNITCHFIEYDNCKNNIFRKSLSIPNNIINTYKSKYISISRYINPKIKESDTFIFHSTYYRICTNHNAINVTTVHDFNYEYFRHGLSKYIHCKQKYYAIRHSDFIICISENTKRDLLKYLPDIDDKKIGIIYNGVSDEYHVLNNINPIKEKFILFVGDRSYYKNFDFIVKSLYNTDYKLVICGKPLNNKEIALLKRYMKDGQYKVFPNIDNKQLNLLYNSAYCLAYPSSYEGFGMPIIEAQKAGCPVIALNKSSIPEIIGNDDLLLNTLSTQDFLSKLELISDSNKREAIIQKGLLNSKRFSIETMCNKYLQLYKYLYENKTLNNPQSEKIKI